MRNGCLCAVLAAVGLATLPARAAGTARSDGTQPPLAQPGASGAAEVGDLHEQEDQKYQFVGARFRYIVIPKFVIGAFADGGTSVGAPAFGLEYTTRKSRFEYEFALMYAGYSMSPTPFKSSSDAADAWELVDANLKIVYATSTFLWSTPFSQDDDRWQFLYGGEAGLGFVFGDLHRTQATPLDPTRPGDPSSWVPCPTNAAGNGPGAGAPAYYCDPSNDHYGSYKEPSWFDGGSKPVFFPWLSFNTGVRLKPSPKFVARLDVGWNLFNGPFFGLAGSFGL